MDALAPHITESMNPKNSDRRRAAAATLLLLLQCALSLAFSPGLRVVRNGGFRQQTSLCKSRWPSKTVLMAKKTQPAPLPTTDDPFLLLGLDSRNPTVDKQEIKRAYRKRAMQYHPDVLLDQDSTEAEREQASKNFARINAAYEMLTGGTKGNANSGNTSTKTASGGYNYQPPHRRSSSYSSSSSTRSTNWEDFMPNYNDEDAKYDAGGDSFGSIFSDLLTGAVGAAAGVAGSRGGGIFGDFIDFLEGNIDGFESGYDDDRSLSELLNYGSFDDIANEMDETDILVTSLETKQKSVENDLLQIQADLNVATKFSEKLDLEERIAELKAREKVVKGYLKKGRNRLVRLRERYKELMVEGRGGRGYGRRSSESSSSSSNSASSSGPSSSYRATNPSTTSSPSPSPPAPATSASSDKNWRTEGFSSSYGRSSSGRRSSRGNRRRTASVDEPSEESFATNQQQSNQQQQQRASESYSNRSSSTTNSSARSSTSSPPKQYEPWVPPHRRSTSSTEAAAQDKKRLRELQVDDEFEKLKREMGM
ncbi:hypothetical protein ACHAXM_009560 [Skeletonema potamos]